MMRKIASMLFALLVGMGLGTVASAQEDLTCEDYRCLFQQQLDQECSCTEKDNHGRYVSCVAHAVNDLVDAGLPTNCKGKLKRCAARSVCGKQDRGFHTCTTFEYGTCDTTTFLCSHDGVTACAVDTDCVISSRCKTTRRPENCEGSLDLSPTCCSTCAVPVP